MGSYNKERRNRKSKQSTKHQESCRESGSFNGAKSGSVRVEGFRTRTSDREGEGDRDRIRRGVDGEDRISREGARENSQEGAGAGVGAEECVYSDSGRLRARRGVLSLGVGVRDS